MILVLSRSDEQNADLQALITAQKQADSHAYHLGLTPEQSPPASGRMTSTCSRSRPG
jgi:hypothetical protein